MPNDAPRSQFPIARPKKFVFFQTNKKSRGDPKKGPLKKTAITLEKYMKSDINNGEEKPVIKTMTSKLVRENKKVQTLQFQ